MQDVYSTLDFPLASLPFLKWHTLWADLGKLGWQAYVLTFGVVLILTLALPLAEDLACSFLASVAVDLRQPIERFWCEALGVQPCALFRKLQQQSMWIWHSERWRDRDSNNVTIGRYWRSRFEQRRYESSLKKKT